MHLLSRTTMQIAFLALCSASLSTANASCFASVGEVPIASSHLQFMPSAMLSDGMAQDGEYQDDHGKRVVRNLLRGWWEQGFWFVIRPFRRHGKVASARPLKGQTSSVWFQ
jgi:hypothetical protein